MGAEEGGVPPDSVIDMDIDSLLPCGEGVLKFWITRASHSSPELSFSEYKSFASPPPFEPVLGGTLSEAWRKKSTHWLSASSDSAAK